MHEGNKELSQIVICCNCTWCCYSTMVCSFICSWSVFNCTQLWPWLCHGHWEPKTCLNVIIIVAHVPCCWKANALFFFVPHFNWRKFHCLLIHLTTSTSVFKRRGRERSALLPKNATYYRERDYLDSSVCWIWWCMFHIEIMITSGVMYFYV